MYPFFEFDNGFYNWICEMCDIQFRLGSLTPEKMSDSYASELIITHKKV